MMDTTTVDELNLQIERDKILVAAANAASNGVHLVSEAVRSDSLNVGAIRGAIEAFERAANTLKPLIR